MKKWFGMPCIVLAVSACNPRTEFVPHELCSGKLVQTKPYELKMFCDDGTVIEKSSYKNYPMHERRSVTSAK